MNTVLQLVFDDSDALWKVFYTVYRQRDGGQDPDAPAALTAPLWRASIAIDLDSRITSVARGSSQGDTDAVNPALVRRVFDVSNLTSGR